MGFLKHAEVTWSWVVTYAISRSRSSPSAVQGGAGTSTNMNANEVIANVALELMGKSRGEYSSLHPNDDVNMAQSTNDAYPTALRLAHYLCDGAAR